VPLLSSIDCERRARKVNPRQERKKEELQDGYQRKTKEIFIAREASRGYSNGSHFGFHAHLSASFRELCIVRRLSRRSSKPSNFLEKGTLRCDGRAAIDPCCGLINVYQTHHQPNMTSDETYQKIEGSMKPINRTRCMKYGFNDNRNYRVDDMFRC
jgi:hypothetical protein